MMKKTSKIDIMYYIRYNKASNMKNFCMIEIFFSKSYDSYIGYVNSM